MPREIQNLLAALEEAYKGPAWHGPSLRASLSRVTAKQAAQRPAPGRHNIWELTVHAAYWKYAVRRQLLGGPRGSFNEEGSNWFQRAAAKLDPVLKEKLWRQDLAALNREHQSLLQAVRKIRESQLDQRVPKSKYTRRKMIAGVAFHDVYHAGQIQLIKRLISRK